jgi:hypothetical protein
MIDRLTSLAKPREPDNRGGLSRKASEMKITTAIKFH